MRFLQVHFDMTLSLLWPVRTVCTTCSIYKEHSSITVCTPRHESVVWGVVARLLREAPWQTQALTPESCGSLIHAPNTSSPGLNRATFLPTASTWPATSTPTRVTFRARIPVIMRVMYGLPFIM